MQTIHNCGQRNIKGDEHKSESLRRKNGHSREIDWMCGGEQGRRARKRKEREEGKKEGEKGGGKKGMKEERKEGRMKSAKVLLLHYKHISFCIYGDYMKRYMFI